MNKIINTCFLLLVLMVLPTQLLTAQNKDLAKAEKAIAMKNYRAALKYADNALEDKEEAKLPNAHYLKAVALYHLSNDNDYLQKEPSAFKECMKSLSKSMDADKKGVFFSDSERVDFLKMLCKKNTAEGISLFKEGKYSKAIGILRRSVELCNDTIAMSYLGESYWMNESKPEAADIFRRVINLNMNAYAEGVLSHTFRKESFRLLTEYFFINFELDSADIYIQMGKELFPDDVVLKEAEYALLKHKLKNTPPSYEYKKVVEKGLQTFPYDSLLLHNWNAIFFYLYTAAANSGESSEADSLLSNFYDTKIKQGKSSHLNAIRKTDYFTYSERRKVMQELNLYLFKRGHFKSLKFSFNRWLADSFKNTTITAAAYQNAVTGIRSSVPAGYIGMVYRFGLEQFPKDKFLIEKRKEYFAALSLSGLTYQEFLDLEWIFESISKDFPKDSQWQGKLKTVRITIIEKAIEEKDFDQGLQTLKSALLAYPDAKVQLNDLYKKLYVEDFKHNFYGSRINDINQNEPNIPTYGWDGDIETCRPFMLDKKIEDRVLQRLNFFRRHAGVRPAYFATDLSVNCQWGALCLHANGTLTHNSAEGMKCYSKEGGKAITYSLVAKDGKNLLNPAKMLNSMFRDNSTFAGNRRWLLNPMPEFGFSATTDVMLVWCVSNGNKADSVKHKQSPVVWPPAYSHKMLTFPKWTFSVYEPLEGAKVEMKYADGRPINLKLHPLVDGYAIPTLVWEPEIPANTLADVWVTVTLKNGKKFTYEVHIIDFDFR